ncbi:MAG: cupin [Candidatus Methanomethylicota archaeon]|nr:MAG: cupin [Candidatus Verstraetearchaeota archaeon]
MEKVVHYTEIKCEEVKAENAKNIRIRWLISKKDGAPNFAMRLFETDRNGNSPYHQHPWEHEIFILEGEGKLIVEDREYNIKEGYAIYIPPNLKHTIKNTGEGKLKFICIIPVISIK